MNKTCSGCVYFGLHSNTTGLFYCASPNEKAKRAFELVGVGAPIVCGCYTDPKEVVVENGAELSLDKALSFMLAGKSRFTLLSNKTGKHYSYQLDKKESTNSDSKYIYFVKIFEGGDKIYAGILWYENEKFKYARGNKGNIEPSDNRIVSLLYVLNNLIYLKYPDIKVFHVGYCGRCGRRLTTPESILTGLGPECSKKCGVPRVRI